MSKAFEEYLAEHLAESEQVLDPNRVTAMKLSLMTDQEVAAWKKIEFAKAAALKEQAEAEAAESKPELNAFDESVTTMSDRDLAQVLKQNGSDWAASRFAPYGFQPPSRRRK